MRAGIRVSRSIRCGAGLCFAGDLELAPPVATTPGREPTSNLAEQAIPFVFIDRCIHGTRSAKGRAWCEHIWTVLATCTRQGPVNGYA